MKKPTQRERNAIIRLMELQETLATKMRERVQAELLRNPGSKWIIRFQSRTGSERDWMGDFLNEFHNE